MDLRSTRMAAVGSWFTASAGREHPHVFFTRYAVERTDSFIKVWFWARNDTSIPADVAGGWWLVDTDNWVSEFH